jgi:hypothetical protein
MGGQPCIRGHRFTVEHLPSLVGAGWALEAIQAPAPASHAHTAANADVVQRRGKMKVAG